MRVSCLPVLLVLAPGALFSQQPTPNPCDGVLVANDFSVRVTSNQWDNYLFRNHCKKTNDSWDFNHEGKVGYEAVKIWGDWTYDKTAVVDFCKRMEQSSRGTSAEADYVSKVVRRSVAAWERCVEIQQSGINIIPTLTPGHVHFEISRTRDDANLQAVVFDAGFARCVVSRDNDVKVYNDSPVALGLPIADGSSISLDCYRAQRTDGQSTSFPAAQVSVNTSRGSLVLDFPDEVFYSAGSSILQAVRSAAEETNAVVVNLRHADADLDRRLVQTSTQIVCDTQASEKRCKRWGGQVTGLVNLNASFPVYCCKTVRTVPAAEPAPAVP